MKLVFGAGMNDAGYVTQIFEHLVYVDGKRKNRLIWVCPDFLDWKHMIERSYSEKFKERNPAYKDAHCIEEWLHMSLFKEWKATQGDTKGKQLDKDIIVPGNKLYSPDTCAYVNRMTNMFVTARDALRGEYPIGVSWNKPREQFISYCRNPFKSKQEYLGLFNDPLEAHEAWRQKKHELAQLVAATESDPRVVEALKKRYSFEEWYKNGEYP